MRGASLLDLVLAIGILAVLASVSVPATAEILRSVRFGRDLEAVSATLRMGSLMAFQHQKEILFGAAGQRFVLRTAESPARIIHAGVLSKETRLSASVQSEDPVQAHFYPSGVASPQTLFIANPAVHCAIIVSLHGRVRHTCQEQLH